MRSVCTPLSVLLAALLTCAALPATAEEISVFFCPSKLIAPGQLMRGIMCDAESCYNTGSAELNAQQRAFLEAPDQPCRSMTPQEVSSLWPKTLLGERQQAAK